MSQSDASQVAQESTEQASIKPVQPDLAEQNFNFDRWAINVRAQMMASLRKRNGFETVDDIRARKAYTNLN